MTPAARTCEACADVRPWMIGQRAANGRPRPRLPKVAHEHIGLCARNDNKCVPLDGTYPCHTPTAPARAETDDATE